MLLAQRLFLAIGHRLDAITGDTEHFHHLLDGLRATLAKRYAGEPFVKVVAKGVSPATRHVRGSNLCLIGVFADRVKGRAIVISAIDNLVKGASGQAIQNFNLMSGIAETAGLEQAPMFP